MSIYNLIEYSENYLKTYVSLCQYYRDKLFINNNEVITNVPDNPDATSFKSKEKLTGHTGNDGTKDVQIIVPLKYLSNF